MHKHSSCNLQRLVNLAKQKNISLPSRSPNLHEHIYYLGLVVGSFSGFKAHIQAIIYQIEIDVNLNPLQLLQHVFPTWTVKQLEKVTTLSHLIIKFECKRLACLKTHLIIRFECNWEGQLHSNSCIIRFECNWEGQLHSNSCGPGACVRMN